MQRLTILAVALVCLFHLVVGFLELVLWNADFVNDTLQIDKDLVRSAPEVAAAARRLLMNAGVYNLCLAAGLAWTLLGEKDGAAARRLQSYLLGFAFVAGIFGALTFNPVNVGILAGQAGLALLALSLVWKQPGAAAARAHGPA